MKRRDFLKHLSILATTAVAPATLLRARAAAAAAAEFQLSLLTDRPDEALQMVEEFFQRNQLPFSHLKFTEYTMVGEHVADIALIRNGRLVDFHRSEDAFSRQLQQIAARLEMPRRVKHPTYMRFYRSTGSEQPERVQVFVQNELVEEFDPEQERSFLRIPGRKGYVALQVRHGSARIVEASCRHRTCMNLGTISHAGQNLVCIPAQIRVALTGAPNNGVDGIVF